MKKKGHNRSRKTRKGGFFFRKNNAPIQSENCNPNNLSMIKGSDALHENYQKCCPSGSFGTKNNSPYCKQVDLNFQVALKQENDENEYHGFEPEQVTKIQQQETMSTLPPPSKPWWKLWGGKKTRKTRKTRKNKKYSRRHRRK